MMWVVRSAGATDGDEGDDVGCEKCGRDGWGRRRMTWVVRSAGATDGDEGG
jgi:hypothetical protein